MTTTNTMVNQAQNQNKLLNDLTETILQPVGKILCSTDVLTALLQSPTLSKVTLVYLVYV